MLFFGGVGEIGKNMTALEYGNDIIIIDAGIIFPTEEMPGIDLVFPDITYLVQNRQKVRGVFLTHGHEDHIGGVPYLLKELNVPVYGTKLTLALVDNKLREHRLNNVTERTVSPKDKVKAGVFTVNFVNVNHSIAGAMALASYSTAATLRLISRPLRAHPSIWRRSRNTAKRECCCISASPPTSNGRDSP